MFDGERRRRVRRFGVGAAQEEEVGSIFFIFLSFSLSLSRDCSTINKNNSRDRVKWTMKHMLKKMRRRTTNSFLRWLEASERKKEKLAISKFVTMVVTRKHMKQAITTASTMKLHIEDAKDATTTTLSMKSTPLNRFEHDTVELTRLIPSLVKIANTEKPTLLSITAADAALRLSVVENSRDSKMMLKLLRTIVRWKLGAEVVLNDTIEMMSEMSNSEWSEFVSTLSVTVLDSRRFDVSKIASHIRGASNAVLSLPSSIRTLCLRLSVIPKSQLSLTFRALDTALSSSTSNVGQPGILLLRTLLTSSPPSTSSLFGYLATQVVNSMFGDKENTDDDALLDTLLNMLKDNSSSSSSSSSFAVHFVANYASLHSSRVLPKLFEIQTAEAMEVIKVMCCCYPTNNQLNRALAGHLIETLDNESIQLRVKAGDVLARCDSTFVIPRLCRNMSKQCSKKLQSASSRALERLLHHSETNLTLAMETLLDTLRCGWSSTLVAAAADEKMEGENNGNDNTWHQHVFNVLKKWSLEANDCEKLVRHILVKVMAAPEDSSSFGFLRSIGHFLVKHHSIVMMFMAQRMEAQGRRRKDDDLFDRLRPELILKVMPDEMFCDDSEKLIWNLIYDRAVCDVEFDAVRSVRAL